MPAVKIGQFGQFDLIRFEHAYKGVTTHHTFEVWKVTASGQRKLVRELATCREARELIESLREEMLTSVERLLRKFEAVPATPVAEPILTRASYRFAEEARKWMSAEQIRATYALDCAVWINPDARTVEADCYTLEDDDKFEVIVRVIRLDDPTALPAVMHYYHLNPEETGLAGGFRDMAVRALELVLAGEIDDCWVYSEGVTHESEFDGDAVVFANNPDC